MQDNVIYCNKFIENGKKELSEELKNLINLTNLLNLLEKLDEISEQKNLLEVNNIISEEDIEILEEYIKISNKDIKMSKEDIKLRIKELIILIKKSLNKNRGENNSIEVRINFSSSEALKSDELGERVNTEYSTDTRLSVRDNKKTKDQIAQSSTCCLLI